MALNVVVGDVIEMECFSHLLGDGALDVQIIPECGLNAVLLDVLAVLPLGGEADKRVLRCVWIFGGRERHRAA